MIVFLTLCYCAVLFAAAKVGIIRLNGFWKASPVLWMALLLLFLFIPMQWGAPSGPVRTYNPVIEIVPNVTGEVIDVPVKPLTAVARGDPLFRIDPIPYQTIVDQKRATLEEARQEVPQLKAKLDAANAFVIEASANRDRAKDEYDRYRTANENARNRGNASTPFNESDVEQRRLVLASSEAGVSRAQASAEQARLAYKSEIGGQNTTVARLEADLRGAEYDLEQTVVKAPSDGFVIGLSLQPGQRVSNLPLRSWLAFAPKASQRIVMAISQTQLRHVKQGQLAEIAFSFRPGEILAATVEAIIPLNAAAQLPPNGILPSLSALYGPNETNGVILHLKDPHPGLFNLPGGAGGTAAIYTQSVAATHVIRKVMIRMDAWLNYLRPS